MVVAWKPLRDGDGACFYRAVSRVVVFATVGNPRAVCKWESKGSKDIRPVAGCLGRKISPRDVRGKEFVYEHIKAISFTGRLCRKANIP